MIRKSLSRLLLLCCMLAVTTVAFAQRPLPKYVVGKGNATQQAGTANTLDFALDFANESQQFDGTAITDACVLLLVDDDTKTGYELPVTSLLTSSPTNPVVRVSTSGLSGINGILNGQFVIFHKKSSISVMPFVSGITSNLQQLLSEAVMRDLETNYKDVAKLTTGSGSVPAVTASALGSSVAINTAGQLSTWNGSSWSLIGSASVNAGAGISIAGDTISTSQTTVGIAAGSITVSQGGRSSSATLPTYDDSNVLKKDAVSAGTGASMTGAGTSASPYVIAVSQTTTSINGNQLTVTQGGRNSTVTLPDGGKAVAPSTTINVDSSGGKYTVSLKQNSVEEGYIVDGAVTGAKIANQAVGAQQIEAGAINGPKISKTGAVAGSILQFDADPAQNTWRTMSPSDASNVYALKTDIPSTPDLSSYATKTALSDSARYIRNETDSLYQKKVAFQVSNSVAYVAKKYAVAGDAAWIAQKAAQSVGNPLTPFVNPNEALRAVAALTVAGTVQKGVVTIVEGNVYRVCEDLDTAGLGTFDYVYRNTGALFHPFPSTTATASDDSLCMSLAFPNIDVIFQKGSGITHVAGRGQLAYIWDTIAPQRISGFGSFNHNVTNSRGASIANITMIGGSTRGDFEFSGDSLRSGRLNPELHGWTMINANASGRLQYRFSYLSTYENNSLFRGNGGPGSVIEIDRFVTDTTVLPYMYLSAPYSPTATFLNNGGYGCNVHIKSAYIASNVLVSYGFYGISGNINFTVDKLEQKFRSAYQTEFIGSASSTTPQGVGVAGTISTAIAFQTNSASTHISKNFVANITIGNYVGQNTLLVFYGSGEIKNSTIAFNLGNIKQDSNSIYPKATIYVNQTGLIDSSSIVVNANALNFNAEALKLQTNSAIKFNGVYKTNSSVRNAIYLGTNASKSALAGNVVVQGPQPSIDGVSGSAITILPSATANTAPTSAVTLQGAPLQVSPFFKF